MRITYQQAKQSMKRSLENANCKGIFSFDFRWAKRRQAKQGTGTLMDPINKKIVDVCSPNKKQVGSSQGNK